MRGIILCDAGNGFYKGYNYNAFMQVMKIKAQERLIQPQVDTEFA